MDERARMRFWMICGAIGGVAAGAVIGVIVGAMVTDDPLSGWGLGGAVLGAIVGVVAARYGAERSAAARRARTEGSDADSGS